MSAAGYARRPFVSCSASASVAGSAENHAGDGSSLASIAPRGAHSTVNVSKTFPEPSPIPIRSR